MASFGCWDSMTSVCDGCSVIRPCVPGPWYTLAQASGEPGWRVFSACSRGGAVLAAEVGSQSGSNCEGPVGRSKWTPDAASTAWGNSGSRRAGPGRCPCGIQRECGAWVCGLAKSLHLPPMGSVNGEARAWPSGSDGGGQPRSPICALKHATLGSQDWNCKLPCQEGCLARGSLGWG